MKSVMKHIHRVQGSSFATVALLFSIGLMGSCGEGMDDSDSQDACEDYCVKKFDCEEYNPTSDESTACINDCVNSIEDNCGNDRQGAANDKIDECVDKSCADFYACMVFTPAPACFDFVNH